MQKKPGKDQWEEGATCNGDHAISVHADNVVSGGTGGVLSIRIGCQGPDPAPRRHDVTAPHLPSMDQVISGSMTLCTHTNKLTQQESSTGYSCFCTLQYDHS